MASAVWHGFYPGYYLAFIGGALFTSSARVVRKTVRPLFLDNPLAKWCYDFSTWFTTRLVVAYLSFTFVLLDFVPSIIIYMKLYFFLHIASIGAVAILPRVAKSIDRRRRSTSSSTTSLNGKKSVSITEIGQTYSTSADYGDQKINTEETQKLKTGWDFVNCAVAILFLSDDYLCTKEPKHGPLLESNVIDWYKVLELDNHSLLHWPETGFMYYLLCIT